MTYITSRINVSGSIYSAFFSTIPSLPIIKRSIENPIAKIESNDTALFVFVNLSISKINIAHKQMIAADVSVALTAKEVENIDPRNSRVNVKQLNAIAEMYNQNFVT